MLKAEIEQRLEKENVRFVSKIDYNQKEYIKTVKIVENGIEYIYYELENDNIKKVEEQEIVEYLKINYEIDEGSISY